MSRIRKLTVWHAALLLPWVVAAVSLRRKFNDNSYLWHVRAGDAQIAEKAVLTADPFSFTMQGAPWRTQSWLAELLYSKIDAWTGLTGPRIMVTVLGAVLFVLLGIVAFRRSRSIPSVVVFLVASAIVTAGFLVPRPVIFSFPLMAALVVAVDDPRLRWVKPLILWVWASVHGSFVIGLAFLGLRAIGRGLGWKRLAELVMVGLPTLLTAHGLGVLDILLDFFGNRSALGRIAEWGRPDLLSLPMLPLFAAFLTLVWLGSSGRIRPRDWWLMVPFLVLAVSANRAVPPAWIALSPILGRITLPFSFSGSGRGPLALGLAAVLFGLPLVLPYETVIDERRFPVEAERHLQTENVFHDDGAGGWLIYSQWPERLVYVDDRAELYGDRVGLFIDIRAVRTDWKEEFAAWGIEEALLKVDDPLARLLEAEGWMRTYEDEYFVIFRVPT